MTTNPVTFARAFRCPCGAPNCDAWMVAPQADVQGVSFTKEEAHLVAAVLNLYIAPVEDDGELSDIIYDVVYDTVAECDGHIKGDPLRKALARAGLEITPTTKIPRFTGSELMGLFPNGIPEVVLDILINPNETSILEKRKRIYAISFQHDARSAK